MTKILKSRTRQNKLILKGCNTISIKIIDAPCGAGKTSWAIQTMNSNVETKYIFCTPFLDEIDRIRKGCGKKKKFVEPTFYNSSKIEDFNHLLTQENINIAVTHSTFLNATPETLELIRNGNYTLIIDEELQIIEDFNCLQSVEASDRQSMSKSDVKFLLDNENIRIESDNKVVWCGGEYGQDHKFAEVKKYAELGRLYCINDQFLLTIFPPEMFKCFDEVYVLTYMFAGSIFKNYFELFNIEYELKSISSEEDTYSLVPHSNEDDFAFRDKCRLLIKILDNPRMNKYLKRTELSKGWYDRATDEDIKRLKANIYNFFRNSSAKACNGDIMWTCPKQYQKDLKGPGYTIIRKMSKEENSLPEKERKIAENRLSCFVPCNAKATNEFKERWALAYCINMFMHPMIKHFFTDGNTIRKSEGLPEIIPDEDAYAVSCLIQWIFRSRIRDGEPIEIYIPSKRMRDLLTAWLECKI